MVSLTVMGYSDGTFGVFQIPKYLPPCLEPTLVGLE